MSKMDQCRYSESLVPLTWEQLRRCDVVECPECGAIRRVNVSPRTVPNYYPTHNTLMGTARTREQWWKKVRGKDEWRLVK